MDLIGQEEVVESLDSDLDEISQISNTHWLCVHDLEELQKLLKRAGDKISTLLGAG